MNKKMVSAIITTHNRVDSLQRAVDSIKKQSYKNIEIIVVDDGSDDGTMEYCQKMGLKRIFIPQQEHKNGNYARNLGIKASHGEYIAFLDDDDEWMPTKIEKQVEAIEQDQKIGVVCVGRIFDVDNGAKSYRYVEQIEPSLQGDLKEKVFYNIVSTTSCIMTKRDVLDKVGMFDEELNFWQETDLMIRICQAFLVAYICEPLVLYKVDYSSKKRLSNKVEGFLEAVEYINKKYAKEISQLSVREQKMRKVMIYGDIANRYSIVGDNKKSRQYLWKAFLVDKNIKRFVKWMFNLTTYRRDKRVRA